MTQLLVSVRSAAEAQAALAGGAHLIDVKEPTRGSLGRADDAVIADVVRIVADRRPVSAALGELQEMDDVAPPPWVGLRYVKWGLAGCLHAEAAWTRKCIAAARRLSVDSPDCRFVAVAYADWQRAQAPTPRSICEFACAQRAGAFLIDTWEKDRSTLLDWLMIADIARLCGRCRAGGVPIALAGSLDRSQILELTAMQPDWFAVRGAVCRNGRSGTVDAAKVRELVALV